MNKNNIKHGYSLMVRDARAPGELFWIQGRKFQKQGPNLCHQEGNIKVRGAILYWGPHGLDFLTIFAPPGPRGRDLPSNAFWFKIVAAAVNKKICFTNETRLGC